MAMPYSGSLSPYPRIETVYSVEDPSGATYIYTGRHSAVRVENASSYLLESTMENAIIGSDEEENYWINLIKYADAREFLEKKSISYMKYVKVLPESTPSESFRIWWDTIGSGIAPRFTEDVEQFAERVAEAAYTASIQESAMFVRKKEEDDIDLPF